MKKLCGFFCLALILSAIALAQVTEEWVARYDGPGSYHDYANAIAIDDAGNVYVTGGSGGDYATVKYNTSGIEQWVARYDGPENEYDQANAIAVDDAGNFYVTGYNEDQDSICIYATIKYSPQGHEEWIALYDAPASERDEARAIAIDGACNVYVTGSSGYNYATVKYSSSGVEQWVARHENGYAYAMAIDDVGYVYVTGISHGDYTTVKYSPSGEEQWVARYDGPESGGDWAKAIAVDGAGNVYVTGDSDGSGSGCDYATVKYSSEGVEQWVARYDGPASYHDYANSIAIDDAGNVYVTGHTDSTNKLHDEDYVTVKYNSDGVEQWVARYDGPAKCEDMATALVIDDSGNVYVTGHSWGLETGNDYATVKYSQGPGVKEAPVTPKIQLSATLNRLTYDAGTSAQLTLYSADGRKVLAETVEGKGIWDVPASLPQGVYFARIHSVEACHMAKLVIVR